MLEEKELCQKWQIPSRVALHLAGNNTVQVSPIGKNLQIVQFRILLFPCLANFSKNTRAFGFDQLI